MAKSLFTIAIIASVSLLSACSDGSSAANRVADFNAFNADPTLANITPDTTIDAMSGTAIYNGIIDIGTDAASTPTGAAGYEGELSVRVAFTTSRTNDAVSGRAGNFVQTFSEMDSPKTGKSVPGQIALTGNLTGRNANAFDGITGRATGEIDGVNVAYTFAGNITGVAGNGMSLTFEGANANSTSGTGLAVD